MASQQPDPLLKLPGELKILVNESLAKGTPMLIAVVDQDGQPSLTFRGSIHVHSDDQLALWIRNRTGPTLTAIQHNPRVALLYRSPGTRAMFQFKGRARVSEDPADRERIYNDMPEVERNGDKEKTGAAVIVDLDTVEGLYGFGASGPIGYTRLSRQPA